MFSKFVAKFTHNCYTCTYRMQNDLGDVIHLTTGGGVDGAQAHGVGARVVAASVIVDDAVRGGDDPVVLASLLANKRRTADLTP